MYYVKNPVGRIVCVDTKEEYDRWLKTRDFSKPEKHEIDRWQNARVEEYEERKLKAKMAKMDGGDIFFATVSGGNDGYGMASQNLYREMAKIGVKISFQNKAQKIGLLFHAPYSVSRLGTQYRILYTMFESTKIPDDWPEYMNEADKILVPSKWCQKVFAESGVKTEVVPLGYDSRFFNYIDRKNTKKTRKTFTFLHYNAYNLRKGFLEVVKAFNDEFDKTEPVKMIFKTNLRKPPIPFMKSKYPNIEVISTEMKAYQLAELCQKSDCFVFPSRGEGFGLPPLEAMATGMPTIIPNAHGISHYFNKEFMYEVKIEKRCPGIYKRYKGQDVGEMFVSNVKHLRQQMRYVYEHQDEAFEKGKKAAEYVKQFTYANTAAKLKEIFDDIMSKPLPERRPSNVLPLELI